MRVLVRSIAGVILALALNQAGAQSSPRVRISIDDDWRFQKGLATDNGDPTNMEPFPSHERRAFNGLALAIIRAKPGQTGRIVVTASSDGISSGRAVITTQAAPR
ncbi:MAG TPA: hypothetical protein VGP95_04665 [Gemmatimonadaceae bacterium]|nr:hypothetical protein [Gemmatimonadaceae bacterium]